MLNVTYPSTAAVDLEARSVAASAEGKAQTALGEVATLGALARRDTVLVSQIADPENLPSGGSGLPRDLGLITAPTSSTFDLGSIL
jgi:hypothetical protein